MLVQSWTQAVLELALVGSTGTGKCVQNDALLGCML